MAVTNKRSSRTSCCGFSSVSVHVCQCCSNTFLMMHIKILLKILSQCWSDTWRYVCVYIAFYTPGLNVWQRPLGATFVRHIRHYSASVRRTNWTLYEDQHVHRWISTYDKPISCSQMGQCVSCLMYVSDLHKCENF